MRNLRQLFFSALFDLSAPTVDRTTYERLFQSVEDPWNFKKSPYERLRLQRLLMAALGVPHERVLEVGCAEGVFTEMLCGISREVVAIDVSQTALDRARNRNRDVGAQFHLAGLENFESGERFDLAVCAEVLYFIHDVQAALEKLNRLARHVLVCYTLRQRKKVEPYLAGIPLLHEEVVRCRETINPRAGRLVLWRSSEVSSRFT